MKEICEAVKEAAATVVLGFAETDGGSLYIAQVTIASNGEIANHRRKIKVKSYFHRVHLDRRKRLVLYRWPGYTL